VVQVSTIRCDGLNLKIAFVDAKCPHFLIYCSPHEVPTCVHYQSVFCNKIPQTIPREVRILISWSVYFHEKQNSEVSGTFHESSCDTRHLPMTSQHSRHCSNYFTLLFVSIKNLCYIPNLTISK
jgi:hypothetical protein